MSEVPGSLTELKIQIGKDIHLHSVEMSYGATDAYYDAMDQVPDQFYVETAERWRAKYPDIPKRFSEAAEAALLELSTAQGGAVTTLLMEMLRYATDMVMTDSDAEAFYAFAILNGVLDADAANAQQYFEALVAYGRGE
jgi:hypothetical protein